MLSLGAASLLSWPFLDRLRLQGYVSGVGRAGWGGQWGKGGGPCVYSAWSRNRGAPTRCDKSQMRYGFEKLEEGILRWVQEMRRKDRLDYLHMSQDMWSRNAQRNRHDLKGENNISCVLTLCWELTMCQKLAPNLQVAESGIEPEPLISEVHTFHTT